jgi:hypothetical protein
MWKELWNSSNIRNALIAVSVANKNGRVGVCAVAEMEGWDQPNAIVMVHNFEHWKLEEVRQQFWMIFQTGERNDKSNGMKSLE